MNIESMISVHIIYLEAEVGAKIKILITISRVVSLYSLIHLFLKAFFSNRPTICLL